ncbi:MAG TPA: radical SAM protein [Candidatus Eremiobacteraceae bacterium]
MKVPSPLVARPDGALLDVPGYSAAVDDGWVRRAKPADFIPLPEGALLLTLPGRSAVVFDGDRRTTLDDLDGVPVDAMAVALPLGYTRASLPAYESRPGAPALPLYGYTAAAWDGTGIVAAALPTDSLESWSAAKHGEEHVRAGIAARVAEFGETALVRQLVRCATEYGCFTAQNSFLRSGEAAIPVSPACNARCIGCISAQDPESGFAAAQERVRIAPSSDEIVALAVAHLDGGGDIVSFGQGCEGEPLLAAPRIASAIREIRARTSAGIVHCNTNASSPRALASLIEAGLQSVRVSLNSARPAAYSAYYRPRGYGFDEVCKSLQVASEAGISVSLNLLTHPGVTDEAEEMKSFERLLDAYSISMVQTRTLNVDPAEYFAAVGRPAQPTLGMAAWLTRLASEFPNVRVGNFTRGFG